MPSVSRWFHAVLVAGLLAAGTAPHVAVAQEPGDPVPEGAVVHDFTTGDLGPGWTVLAPDPSRYAVTDGVLRVESLQGDTFQNVNSARNVFLLGIPDGDFEVVAEVSAEVSLDFQ